MLPKGRFRLKLLFFQRHLLNLLSSNATPAHSEHADAHFSSKGRQADRRTRAYGVLLTSLPFRITKNSVESPYSCTGRHELMAPLPPGEPALGFVRSMRNNLAGGDELITSVFQARNCSLGGFPAAEKRGKSKQEGWEGKPKKKRDPIYIYTHTYTRREKKREKYTPYIQTEARSGNQQAVYYRVT